jgi:hypothetical protein
MGETERRCGMSWDWEVDQLPALGQKMGFATAVGSFVRELRERQLENTPENRQLVYKRLNEPAGAAILREAKRNGWSAAQVDAVLEMYAGTTGAEEGSPTTVEVIPIDMSK